jgi:pimeloyl-ACP methyl ester carboxylesterase
MKNKNILLLGGLMQESQHWGTFIGKIQKQFPDYHILPLDLPGNGKHFKLRSFLSIRKNVLFLRDQWKKRIDYPSDNIIVGLSMGGMVAMEWCMLYPEDWKKAIIINTSHGSLSPFYKRFNLLTLFRFLYFLINASEKRKQELLFYLTVNDIHKKKTVIDQWVKIAKAQPVKYKNILRQLWACLSFRKITAQASVSTHIICSRMDRLVSPHCSEQLAKHWNAPISYHETAGHDPCVDATDWLVEKIQKIILSK